MRIGIRAGHTTRSCGSSGILNENIEARRVKAEVVKILSNYAEVVDLQPNEDMPYPNELMKGVEIANDSNLDLAFSIHFNNAYNSYEGAIGTECHVYPSSSAIGKARAIRDNLVKLGFKYREVCERTDLGELRRSNMPWIIVEVCFVEATEDAKVYNSVGASSVAKAIVEGILDKAISSGQKSSAEKETGYVITNYLPEAWEGYNATDLSYVLKYFKDINCYMKSDEKGRWIETQNLPIEKCLELKETLVEWFYKIG